MVANAVESEATGVKGVAAAVMVDSAGVLGITIDKPNSAFAAVGVVGDNTAAEAAAAAAAAAAAGNWGVTLICDGTGEATTGENADAMEVVGDKTTLAEARAAALRCVVCNASSCAGVILAWLTLSGKVAGIQCKQSKSANNCSPRSKSCGSAGGVVYSGGGNVGAGGGGGGGAFGSGFGANLGFCSLGACGFVRGHSRA